MRITARLISLVGTFVVAMAGPALAGPYPVPKPSEEVLPTVVHPASPVSEAGLAFTGAEMTLLFTILAVLVITGVGALLAARRRARVPA